MFSLSLVYKGLLEGVVYKKLMVNFFKFCLKMYKRRRKRKFLGGYIIILRGVLDREWEESFNYF